MRTIEQIKTLRAQGHRKWGMDLYYHILPLVEQFLSLEEISQQLADEHELEITAKRLRYILHYYRRKLQIPSRETDPRRSASYLAARPIAQNREDQKCASSSPTQFSPVKKLIIDEDYRTPTPKPRPIFGTKEALDS